MTRPGQNGPRSLIADDDAAPGGDAGHASVARDRQRRVRGGHRVHVVDLAAGGALAVELAAVPAREPALAELRARSARARTPCRRRRRDCSRTGSAARRAAARPGSRSRSGGAVVAGPVVEVVAAAAARRWRRRRRGGRGGALASRSTGGGRGALAHPAIKAEAIAADRRAPLRASRRLGSSRSRLDQLAMLVDAHQDAEPEKQRDERGAAVGDERQRHAHHRQDAAHHAHVDERVGEEVSVIAPASSRAKNVGAPGGDDSPRAISAEVEHEQARGCRPARTPPRTPRR